VPAPRPRKISDFKPTLTRLAQTSHYELSFGGLPTPLRQHLNVRGVGYRFITETSGLLCSAAVIPGSSLATADIVGNFMGVSEKMAHTRAFTEIQLEFYVDYQYKTIKFFEHWMEFISSGSGESQAQDGYYFRMVYPDDYKCNQTKLIKFDRDYDNAIEYTFYGMFPVSMNSIPVNYGNSEILKATVTFNVDRYIAGRYDSYSLYRGNYGNIESNENSGSVNNDFANYEASRAFINPTYSDSTNQILTDAGRNLIENPLGQ
jgi:hypothetical protein